MVIPVLLMTVLLASSMLVLQARGADTTTTASLNIVPNPVGVGQNLAITAQIQPNPPLGYILHGLEIDVTKPDGNPDALASKDSDGFGIAHFTYTPSEVGTYHFKLVYPGEDIGIDSVYYLGSESSVHDVIVQEEPVPANVIHPDPLVWLTFVQPIDPSAVSLTKSTDPPLGVPPLAGIITPYYDIKVTSCFSGKVQVCIQYDDTGLGGRESTLRMYRYDYLLGDVNHDGKVDLKDLRAITIALATKTGDRRWNKNCDVNFDGKVDLKDLFAACLNLGKSSRWIDITTGIDTTQNFIYGVTDRFSIFGVR